MRRAEPKQATASCLIQLLFILTTSDLGLAAEVAAEARSSLTPATPTFLPRRAQSPSVHALPFMRARTPPHRNSSFMSEVAKAIRRYSMRAQGDTACAYGLSRERQAAATLRWAILQGRKTSSETESQKRKQIRPARPAPLRIPTACRGSLEPLHHAPWWCSSPNHTTR